MTRDETAGTEWTLRATVSGCFAQEYAENTSLPTRDCSSSDMRRPDRPRLVDSAARVLVCEVQELVGGQGAEVGGAAGGDQVDGDLAVG
jgi:hypothetical protein